MLLDWMVNLLVVIWAAPLCAAAVSQSVTCTRVCGPASCSFTTFDGEEHMTAVTVFCNSRVTRMEYYNITLTRQRAQPPLQRVQYSRWHKDKEQRAFPPRSHVLRSQPFSDTYKVNGARFVNMHNLLFDLWYKKKIYFNYYHVSVFEFWIINECILNLIFLLSVLFQHPYVSK